MERSVQEEGDKAGAHSTAIRRALGGHSTPIPSSSSPPSSRHAGAATVRCQSILQSSSGDCTRSTPRTPQGSKRLHLALYNPSPVKPWLCSRRLVNIVAQFSSSAPSRLLAAGLLVFLLICASRNPMEASDHPHHPSWTRFTASQLPCPSSAHSAIAYEWSHLSFPNNYRGARFMTPPPSASPSPCPTPALSRGSTPPLSAYNTEIEIEELPDSYQSHSGLLHGEYEEPSSEPEHLEDVEEVHLIHGLSQLSAKPPSPIRPRWGMSAAVPMRTKKKRTYTESVEASEDDDHSDGAIDSDYSASSGGGRIRRRKIANTRATFSNSTVSPRHSQVFDMDMDL